LRDAPVLTSFPQIAYTAPTIFLKNCWNRRLLPPDEGSRAPVPRTNHFPEELLESAITAMMSMQERGPAE
jgi:hypothetical protein